MNYIVQHHHTLRSQPFEALNGITVLLVEPEAEDRSFYSNQLSDVNVNVVPVDDLKTMHVMAQESNPDVVIVNPSRDITTGIQLVKSLKQEFPDLPVITMSMTMREDHLDAIMESGASVHINRGLTRPRDLLLALEQVIVIK